MDDPQSDSIDIVGPQGPGYGEICRIDRSTAGTTAVNARLIAAAPELLDALNEARKALRGMLDMGAFPSEQTAARRAIERINAIKAARGLKS